MSFNISAMICCYNEEGDEGSKMAKKINGAALL